MLGIGGILLFGSITWYESTRGSVQTQHVNRLFAQLASHLDEATTAISDLVEFGDEDTGTEEHDENTF